MKFNTSHILFSAMQQIIFIHANIQFIFKSMLLRCSREHNTSKTRVYRKVVILPLYCDQIYAVMPHCTVRETN